MDRKTLMAEWPKDGQDVEGAERLLRRGYPALSPVVPDMVDWLKTSGPVRERFCSSLAAIGGAATEPVQAALSGSHESQIEQLMRFVLPYWSAEELVALAPDLERHLQRGSLVGLNVMALALLQRAGAQAHAPVEEWADLFRRRLQLQLEALDRIDAAGVRQQG